MCVWLCVKAAAYTSYGIQIKETTLYIVACS